MLVGNDGPMVKVSQIIYSSAKRVEVSFDLSNGNRTVSMALVLANADLKDVRCLADEAYQELRQILCDLPESLANPF